MRCRTGKHATSDRPTGLARRRHPGGFYHHIQSEREITGSAAFGGVQIDMAFGAATVAQ
jgi:hypothetical protein